LLPLSVFDDSSLRGLPKRTEHLNSERLPLAAGRAWGRSGCRASSSSCSIEHLATFLWIWLGAGLRSLLVGRRALLRRRWLWWVNSPPGRRSPRWCVYGLMTGTPAELTVVAGILS
jgi:hypothetical protein